MSVELFPVTIVVNFLSQLEIQESRQRRYAPVPQGITVYRGQQINCAFRPKLLRFDDLGDEAMTSDFDDVSAEERTKLLHDKRLRWEADLLEEFKRQSAPFLSNATKPDDSNDLEWLALAQHHGLATRLLDWSQSPLIALFFAVEAPPITNQNDSVVWSFTGMRLTKTIQKKQISGFDEMVIKVGHRIYFPNHISQRFVAQQGCFTVHSLKPFHTPDLDIPGTHIGFTVPVSLRETIKEELNRIGINYVSLFPDLDGLSRKLNWMSGTFRPPNEIPSV